MRIAIDTQSTLGHKTGIGQYTSGLLASLKKVSSAHEYIELNLGQDVVMRLDRRLRWQQVILPRQARAARVDILHVPGFDAPRYKPCPVILTVHDVIGMIYPHNLPLLSRFYWAWWLPRSVRWADRILADSEHTKRDLVRLVKIPPAQVKVIHLGVDPAFRQLSDLTTLQRIRYKYHLPEKFVLYLGTLEPRKGLDTLVAAYGLLAPEVEPDLVIVGKKGWYTEPLFQQVESLGIKPRVHFTGYAPDEDLPALYNLASLFVYPSHYEGFGLPPLEAMACGTPVISSNAASLPEVVGEAGLQTPPGNVPALSQAMARALNDTDLRETLSHKGLEQAARFTWEETARQTLQIYEEFA